MSVNMNKKLLVILVLFVVLFSVVYLKPLNKFIKISSCSLLGGKFSASTRECIYKSCAETGSCQASYGNTSVCKSLKPNLSKNELYFELGMPIRIEGDAFYFRGSAGEKTQVRAILLNGNLKTLECEI